MAHVNPNGRKGPRRNNVLRGHFGNVDSASATSQTQPSSTGAPLDTGLAANAVQLGAMLEQLVGQVRSVSAYLFDPRMPPETSASLTSNMQTLQATAHSLALRLQTATNDENGLLALRRDLENFGVEVQNFVEASLAAYNAQGGALPLPPGPEAATGTGRGPFPLGLVIGGGLGVVLLGGMVWAAVSSKPARVGATKAFQPPPRVKLKRMRKARPAP